MYFVALSKSVCVCERERNRERKRGGSFARTPLVSPTVNPKSATDTIKRNTTSNSFAPKDFFFPAFLKKAE